jgi:hypothetical protein
MKMFRYLVYLTATLVLFACSNGANRTNDASFGNLQSFSQIGLGGISSQAEVSVNELQGYADSLVCPSIIESSTLLDDVVLSGGDQTGADLCQANQSYVTDNTSLFGLDGSTESNSLSSFVSANALGVTGVNMYRISYNTQSQTAYYNGGAVFSQNVSGLVIVPQGVPASAIKGIVLYYHGTALSKLFVPSFTDTLSQSMLAAVYASQGYIVVAPDYLGQGINKDMMHPYVVFPQANALDGLNMVNATRQFLERESVINVANTPENLPTTVNQNLYVTGYSEGGPYALWASRMLQGANAGTLTQNNLTFKDTVGMSGAYDLSSVMLPYAYAETNNSPESQLNLFNAEPGMLPSSQFFLSGQSLGELNIESGIQQSIAALNLSISKASLSSYAFVALAYYNFVSSAYSVFFPNQNFFNMSTCLNLSTYLASAITGSDVSIVPIACPIINSLPNLFLSTDPDYTDTRIGQTISASAMYNTGFFTGNIVASDLVRNIFSGQASPNSVGAFAQPVETDPLLLSTVAKADTASYVTNIKTAIFYLKYDSTVTNINSKNACSSSGVLGLSPDGMVNCGEIDNSSLFTAFDLSSLLGLPFQLPMMMSHGNAFYVVNLAALNNIRSNP